MSVVRTGLAIACLALWSGRAGAQQTGVTTAPVTGVDHTQHQSAALPPPAPGGSPEQSQASSALPPFIRPVTDADRAAAFPDVHPHAMSDKETHAFVLFDRLEWLAGDGRPGVRWDTRGWVGGNRDRLWFRTEGDVDGGRLAEGHAHLLYGRAISPWWELVGGVRQDARPGAAQTWAAIGLQGVAPYRFEVEATAYIGASARTGLHVKAEYELLVTNRLIAQPIVEIDVHGKADERRGVAAGQSTAEVGLRLRYELRREFAPYLGVTWQRTVRSAHRHAGSAGGHADGARLAVGLRWWM